MKRIYMVLLSLLAVSFVFAAEDNTAQATAQPQAAAAPAAGGISQDGQYSLGISNGLLFRFLAKDFRGYEIPLAVNYTTSNSGDVMTAGATSGFGFVLPLKIAGGLHVNFIPEITGGYNRTLSITNNTEYNGTTKENETVNLRNSSYTITAGAVFKLEVEYFLNNLISFLPGNISIGGNVAVTVSENYAESNIQTYDGHLYVVDSTHTCYFGNTCTLALTGTSLSTLVIRYYF